MELRLPVRLLLSPGIYKTKTPSQFKLISQALFMMPVAPFRVPMVNFFPLTSSDSSAWLKTARIAAGPLLEPKPQPWYRHHDLLRVRHHRRYLTPAQTFSTNLAAVNTNMERWLDAGDVDYRIAIVTYLPVSVITFFISTFLKFRGARWLASNPSIWRSLIRFNNRSGKWTYILFHCLAETS